MAGIPQRSTRGLPGKRASGGFTLLELLLAFLVFSLAFATVLEILSGSMRNTIRARQYTEAAMTAQSVMARVGLEIPLAIGSSASGESGDYRWSLEIYPYEDVTEGFAAIELAELTGVTLLQIELFVEWGQPPRDQSRRFSTVKGLMSEFADDLE